MQNNKSVLNIPDKIADILKTAGAVGDRQKVKVFGVGGFVRDLLLGADNLDIDIVVEGDGLKFAQNLAGVFGGNLIIHKQFGTATIEASYKVDIATARSEHYKFPCAYPSVNFGTIEEDLKRRDFTINAIAISLNSRRFAKIVDFFNGRKDLENGIIKVLHDKSFIDDSTRIFRAVRFEQRYNFKIDAHTRALIGDAVKAGMLDRLKKQRMEKEIAFILKEQRAPSMLKRLKALTGIRYATHRQDK
jgi:tRNA nucleotidyltransferase (CCA-adding enzyme)